MSFPIRLLTYNIHKGVHPLTRKKQLEHLRTLIQLCDVDIVCLQEFKVHANHQTLEFFTDQIWNHYSYAQNASNPKSSYGNTIFSKYPILEEKVLDLTQHSLEKRSCLSVRIEIPEIFKEIWISTTHLDLTAFTRRKQIELCIDELRSRKNIPQIFAGDLNDYFSKMSALLESKTDLKSLSHALHKKPLATFPSFYPILPLDQIYYSGLTAKECRVISPRNAPYSDHLPLYGVFEL